MQVRGYGFCNHSSWLIVFGDPLPEERVKHEAHVKHSRPGVCVFVFVCVRAYYICILYYVIYIVYNIHAYIYIYIHLYIYIYSIRVLYVYI